MPLPDEQQSPRVAQFLAATDRAGVRVMSIADRNNEAAERYFAAMEAWLEARRAHLTCAFEAELLALDEARVQEVNVALRESIAAVNKMGLSMVKDLDLIAAHARGETAALIAAKPLNPEPGS